MYTLKFLDSESFDKLPYNKASTALGIADRNRMEAYVRDTANPMDAFTAIHELEHLKGDDLGEHESPDENGVYYKETGSWMQTLAPLAAFIPGVGPLASAGLAAGGTAMNASNQGKAQNSAMLDQQRAQESMMSQFQSQPQQTPNTIQAPQAPNVVNPGGMGGGNQGGSGGMGSDLDLIRRAQQKGNYSGRGGF